MTREEFIKQRCEIDKITEEEFEKRYRVVKCNCGQPYCKGYRCLDLDGLLKENQELKKQLEVGEQQYNDLVEEKEKLKERISYLERSIERKEETITELELERVPYTNEYIEKVKKENEDLKRQLGEYQLQNIDLREDIMIQKIAFPNKLIKDKTFYDLYDMPTYEELLEQQQEFIKYLENEINICDGFLDTVKSDLQEIPYGVISVNKTYITTQIKENETAHKVYEEILQKYKKIIGGK